MAIEDNESCSSRAVDSSPMNPRQQRHKLEVYNQVLRRLKESASDEANLPGFDDEIWAHFNRLPARYALDVNVERAEDVLRHKRLLQLAQDPANRPAFDIRVVQVPLGDGNGIDPFLSNSPQKEDAPSSSSYLNKQSIHPPPTFGSSPNLEALALEANKTYIQDGESAVNANPLFASGMCSARYLVKSY